MIAVATQEPEAAPQASPQPVELPRFSIRAVGNVENQWFDVSIAPGETANLTASIRNTGDISADLRTYATNAQNPVGGGFSAATYGDEPAGPTLWLDYPSDTFASQPGDERLIDFTVSVPAETAPGHYVAALVVQTAESVGIPGTEMFRQIIRSAISVEITVPGEATSGFALGEPVVSSVGGQWVLDVPITNTGTARLRPQGELVVATPEGEEVSRTRVEMGSVYGGATTSVRAALPGQLPLGEYRVSLDLIDEATGATDAIGNAPVTLAEPEVEAPPMFSIDAASVTPNGDPVRYAEVAATITNTGPDIPTANVTLVAARDGAEVERYPLAEDQALLRGTTEFGQRYIPVDGWQPGNWTFRLVISAVSGDTETVVATVEIADAIAVP